jgi:plastocyanin
MSATDRRVRCWAAAVMMVLAACQGESTSPQTTSQAASAEITAEATEFQFTPSDWTVAPEATVMLTLINQGTEEHTFTVVTGGGRVDSATELDEVAPVAQAEAGATVDATFTAPSEPGSYQVVCTIAGHLEAGMEATLTVTQP